MSGVTTHPNALTVRFRRWLAARITVSPVPGEAWCLQCGLNDGRTLVINADGWNAHARLHLDDNNTTTHAISVVVSWPRNHLPGSGELV